MVFVSYYRPNRKKSHFKKIILLSTFSILAVYFIVDYFTLKRSFSNLKQDVFKSKDCNINNKLTNLKEVTVRIIDDYGEGSGFFIDPEGYVVTNAHVVTETLRPKIVFPNSEFVMADIVYHDNRGDIAILKAESLPEDINIIKLSLSEDKNSGENIIILGYPLGRALPGEITVTKGYISARRDWNEKSEWVYQIGASVQRGNSGGPVFDECGDLVGVVTATVGYLLNIGIVIPAEYVGMVYKQAMETPKKVDYSYTEQVDLETEEGIVSAFYFFQNVRQLRRAYDLLSKDMIGDLSFEEWQKGYENTLNVYTISVKKNNDSGVYVKFVSVDLIDQEFINQYFEGYWFVKNENGVLELFDAKIEKIG